MGKVNSIRVVCAIMLNEDAEVLIARRKEGRVRAGFWEFPGGKIHANESPERAIAREINEEMSIDIIPERILSTYSHEYPDLNIELIAVLCKFNDLPVLSTDHDSILWVKKSELKNQTLSEADLRLWELIERNS
jgi:8-oxo-dGTP diphosphatase